MQCFGQIKEHEAFKGKVQSMLDLAAQCKDPEETLFGTILSIIKTEEFEFSSGYGGMNTTTQRTLVMFLVNYVLSQKVVDVSADV